VSYDISKIWSFSTVWVYGTGSALTVPVSYYFIEGDFVTEYGERNAFRMPAYHRLDISFTLTPDRELSNVRRKQRLINKYKKQGKDIETIEVPKKWAKNYETSWNFSVFNLYNRHNPYIVFFDASGTITSPEAYDVRGKQMYLFPILPSITWSFKF
jgi:hypothetical protein